jgi:hypothetical protein
MKMFKIIVTTTDGYSFDQYEELAKPNLDSVIDKCNVLAQETMDTDVVQLDIMLVEVEIKEV